MIFITAWMKVWVLCSALGNPAVVGEPIPPDIAWRAAQHILNTHGQYAPELLAAIVWGESRGIHTKINPRTGACGPMQTVVSPKRCAWLLRDEVRGYIEGVRFLDTWQGICANYGHPPGRARLRCALAGYRGGRAHARAGRYANADHILKRAQRIGAATARWWKRPTPLPARKPSS